MSRTGIKGQHPSAGFACQESREGNRILVLGMGNPLMADDGAGLTALSMLEEGGNIPDNVDLVDGGTMGLYLIDRLCGYKRVLILDTVLVDEPPGTVVLITGEDVFSTFKSRLTAHQAGFNDLISALVLLDRKPPEIAIVGIVPEKVALTLEMTESVKSNIGKMLRAAAEVLADWND